MTPGVECCDCSDVSASQSRLSTGNDKSSAMTLNTLKIAKRMQDAGMPREQSEALATVLDEDVGIDLVTHADLGAAVDRLESRMDRLEQRLDSKIDGVEQRLDGKIDAVSQILGGRIDRLDDKIDASLLRVENTMWRVGLAILGGGLAIGGVLLRFVR